MDSKRSLFVHVPDIPVYSSDKTARGLEKILELCLEQINNFDTNLECLDCQQTDISDDLKHTTLNDNKV